MHNNSYIRMVEPNVPRLIASRARRLRVHCDEIEDLQQQIVPLLAEFHFDPARANGAKLATAMTGVIDRQIKAHLRAERRYRHRIEQASEQVSGLEPHRRSLQWVNALELKLDVQAAMGRLSALDQSICKALGDGHNISSIARQLCISRDATNSAIRRIRRTFASAGLHAWLGLGSSVTETPTEH